MVILDIGNTNIQFARLTHKQIGKISKAPIQNITKLFITKKILSSKQEKVFICSVVPKITRLFLETVKNPYIVGTNIKIPINSLYRKKDIGSDRLIAAYAASIFFPQTRLILDFGTAITLDFISRSGVYQGGIILPGVGSTMKTFSRCALLPKKISFKPLIRKIPRNTTESINSGLQEGFSIMVNGLVAKYSQYLKINNQVKVLITGGGVLPIINKLNFRYQYDPRLILKGLAHLALSTL